MTRIIPALSTPCAMPALYLLLAFHAVWLTPLQWWQQPVGVLMAILLTGGSLKACIFQLVV